MCWLDMKEIQFPISLTSSALLLYVVFTYFNMPYALVFTLFLVVNVLFIWMIIRILKDGKPSEKSFDDYFYEDFPEKRS